MRLVLAIYKLQTLTLTFFSFIYSLSLLNEKLYLRQIRIRDQKFNSLF